jgi:hypothetical protein
MRSVQGQRLVCRCLGQAPQWLFDAVEVVCCNGGGLQCGAQSHAADELQTHDLRASREMTRHAEMIREQVVSFIFTAPWQRGSNDNISELIRQCLPEGTPANADAIVLKLNMRPRGGLASSARSGCRSGYIAVCHDASVSV